jgi:hypothetical protein
MDLPAVTAFGEGNQMWADRNIEVPLVGQQIAARSVPIHDCFAQSVLASEQFRRKGCAFAGVAPPRQTPAAIILHGI